MKYIVFDFEVSSSVDLKTKGPINYVKDTSTVITHIGYQAYDMPEAVCIAKPIVKEDLDEFMSYLKDKDCWLVAFNAMFEFLVCNVVLRRLIGYFSQILLKRFICVQYQAYYNGIFLGSLEKLAEYLMTKNRKVADRKYDKMKKEYFRGINQSPKNTEFITEYCIADVATTHEIFKKIPLPSRYDHEGWIMTQKINMTGFKVNTKVCESVTRYFEVKGGTLNSRIQAITGYCPLRKTGVESVTKVAQIKSWLEGQNVTLSSLTKDNIQSILDNPTKVGGNEKVLEVLKLRSIGSKGGIVAKYKKALDLHSNSIIRNSMTWRGAATTRWTANGFQVQNTPSRGVEKDLDRLREMKKEAVETDLLHIDISNISHYALSLVKPCIEADTDEILYVADLAQIEPRLIAYYLDETELLKMYQTEDCYRSMYSFYYNTPISRVTSDDRTYAKTALLAKFYQAGANRIYESMPTHMQAKYSRTVVVEIVAKWRAKNRKVTRAWVDLQNKVRIAIVNTNTKYKALGGKVTIYAVKTRGLICLKIILADGKTVLSYPDIAVDSEGSIAYAGFKNGRYLGRDSLYGGKIFNNIIQGSGALAMRECTRRVKELPGVEPCILIHDEVVSRVKLKRKHASLEEYALQFKTPIDWCKDMPLDCSSYKNEFYHKD